MEGSGQKPVVMVIEDEADLREQLCEMLAFEGYQPLPQARPESALARLAWGALPAVIILDLALPGMGGAGFLRRLRTFPAPWSSCPVLLLSGWGHLERLGLPVDMTMRKPPDAVSLARAVDRLAARRSHIVAPPPGPRPLGGAVPSPERPARAVEAASARAGSVSAPASAPG